MNSLYLILSGIIQFGASVKISQSSFNVVHGPIKEIYAPSERIARYSYDHISLPSPQIFSHYSSPLTSNGYSAAPQLQSLIGSYSALTTPNDVRCAAAPLNCEKSLYRTLDGSCNNLQNPALGIANSRYGRLLTPKYGDGISSPTLSVTGHELPNARLISLTVFGEEDVPDPEFTLFNMQFGQIITHDMSMTAGGTQTQKHARECCSENGQLLPKESIHSSCYPIVVPPHDPVFSQTRTQCLNFVRSLTDLAARCPGSKLYKPVEQITTVSHYLDLSLVYGNSEQQHRPIRAYVGGKMRVDERDGYEWMPQSNNASGDCQVESPNEICYLAGDVRVNQNPGLTILQTILLREHNRIADTLAKLNPYYDDEQLFQEARKINTGQYQYINYYEWLPIFLGTDNMLKNRLIYKTPDNSYINDYDPSIDPSTLNEHATAAFRYFHSQIEGRLDLLSEHRSLSGALRLSDWFGRPGIIETGDNYDSLIRGHATQPEELTDINFDREIKHYLFRGRNPVGSDLRSIDIQRNRDHGLASYNDFREFCGLPRAHTWEGFLDLISEKNIGKLKSLYEDPNDVDLTVGASIEIHVTGSLAGPTFLCILTEQFYRTRVGDRFFFERGDKTGFTREQLAEIRKASMARLLCDNSNHVKSIQPAAFLTVSKGNPIVSCDEIPRVDLSKWSSHGEDYSGHATYFDFKK